MSLTSIALLISSAFGATPDGILLEFSASWCGPCQQMSPIVSRLERQGYPIRKVDVDRERALAQKFRITSIPAFVLVIRGKEVEREVGALSESRLQQMMAQIPAVVEPPESPTVPPVSGRGANVEFVNATTPTANERIASNDDNVRSGIRLPLFGGKKDTSESAEVAETVPVIRAKNDGSGIVSDAGVSSSFSLCTRIRIRDASGVNYGSGTFIDSQPGRTLILTCAHVLRDVDENSVIEVDVFDGERFETFVGKPMGYDAEADVGLIAIPTVAILPVARVASLGSKPERGESVFSFGCGGGEPPSREDHQVTAINRYLGPDNIECTGVPVQGRSGGGLLNQDGNVIGVCVAADPKDKRGLYAGLKAIHNLLDDVELSHLIEKEERPVALASGREFVPVEAGRDSSFGEAEPMTEFVHADVSSQPSSEFEIVGVEPEAAGGLNGIPAGAIDGIEGVEDALQRAGDAEVICIIRPLNNPQAASRVVIINRASSKFIAELTGEVESQPQTTSRRIANDPGTEVVHTARKSVVHERGSTATKSNSTFAPQGTKPFDQRTAGRGFNSFAPHVEQRSFQPKRYVRSQESRLR